MGRKRGDNPDTDLKAQAILKKKIQGKNVQQCAKELGIHRNTVTNVFKRAISNEQIQAIIQRSIDRNAMMLSKCDRVLNRVLDEVSPDAMGHQMRAVEGMYKSFGVWKQEPTIQINNFTPIVLTVGDEIVRIALNPASEAGPRIQEQE